MKKRTFLKISVAAPFLGLPGEKAMSEDAKLTNWAGNYTYSTDKLDAARSVEEVQQLVKKHDKVRVLGTRHSFNGIADSKARLLSVTPMERVLELDSKARTVTVEAGLRYGQLCSYLYEKGFALHNLASLPHISIAGACATATHGSGDKNRNLATALAAVELVNAAGEVVHLSREKDARIFAGVAVNLGALGVVTKVTLDLVPAFDVRQYVYENLPLDQLGKHFDDITSAGYSVSFFTDWQRKRIGQVWVKQRVEKGAEAKAELFGATIATKRMHPSGKQTGENCTEQLGIPGPWYERLPHFRMGFTPSTGKELQAEYFVPRKHAVDAILAVEKLRDSITPHLIISELRMIAADENWMSTAYKQDSLAIHFTWKPDWESVQKVLPMIEKELAPFSVRPHWAKLFTIPPKTLQGRYEKLGEFKQLLKEFDPQGKFRNDFLDTNLYG